MNIIKLPNATAFGVYDILIYIKIYYTQQIHVSPTLITVIVMDEGKQNTEK